MSIEKFVEEVIRDAMERGEFSNLKGEGMPLDLEAYFDTPEDLRMAYSLLKSNHHVPAEVDLINQIAGLKERLRLSGNETERRNLWSELERKELTLRLSLESRRR